MPAKLSESFGYVYLRGHTWWINCCDMHGHRKRFSSKSRIKEEAQDDLDQYLIDSGKTPTVHFPKESGFITKITAKHTPYNIGVIAERLVEIDLINHGFHVFSACCPNGPCDLIFLDQNKRPHLVEVKMGRSTKSGRVAYTKPSKSQRFDVLAIVKDREAISYYPRLEDLLRCGENSIAA